MQHQVILSLGSNLGNRQAFIQQAIALIDQRVGTVISVSKLYETPAWGFESHHFLNAAILVHTYFSAEDVLHKILNIEHDLGRNRHSSNGYKARTMDIDIIAFDDEIIETENLIVPHPQMIHRKFVLVPLADICPDWQHPQTKISIQDLLKQTNDDSALTAVGTLTAGIEKYREKIKGHLVIEGNIGSGKTSLAKKISEDFGIPAVLETFEDNPFIADFYADANNKAFSLEMHFLLARIEQLKNLKSNSSFVFDYHLEKCLLFAKETLSEYEFVMFAKVFDYLSTVGNSIHTYVYLHQPTAKLLQQIKARNRSFETNISADYLNKISFAYQNHFDEIQVDDKVWIDMSALDFKKNPGDYFKILSAIFNS